MRKREGRLGATAGSGASSLPPKHGVSAPSPPPAPARRQGDEINPETGVYTLQGLQTPPQVCWLPWSSQRLDEAGLAIPLSSKGQTCPRSAGKSWQSQAWTQDLLPRISDSFQKWGEPPIHREPSLSPNLVPGASCTNLSPDFQPLAPAPHRILSRVSPWVTRALGQRVG